MGETRTYAKLSTIEWSTNTVRESVKADEDGTNVRGALWGLVLPVPDIDRSTKRARRRKRAREREYE